MAAAGILTLAAALRLHGVTWGMRDGVFFPDELLWIGRGARFVPLTPQSFAGDSLVYPTLYGYLVGLAVAAAHAAGLLADPSAGPFGVLLAGRLVSAAAGVLNVALVGMLGALVASPAIGLVAAACMAVVPLDVVLAHYASVDVLLMACVTATLLAARCAVRDGGRATVGAGFAAGLAAATKYTGFAALAPAFLVAVERAIARRRLRVLLAVGAVLAVAALLGLSVGCPPCVAHSDTMLAAMRMHRNITAQAGTPNNRLVPSLGWCGTPYVYPLVVTLPYALGWPLYLLALAGVVAAVRRRDAGDRVLLAGVLPYFLVVGAAPVTFIRYLLPLLPPLVVLAARMAGTGVRRIATVGLGAAWLYAIALSVSLLHAIPLDQQREVAAWLAEHVRGKPVSGAPCVGVAGGRYEPYFALSPFLTRAGLRPVTLPDGHWLDPQCQAIVVPHWIEVGIRRDAPGSPLERELDLLASGQAGYREAMRWRTDYLHRAIYQRWDPGLGPALGWYGFTAYVRVANDAP